MATKPTTPDASQLPSVEQVSDALVTAFGKVFSYHDVVNNRSRCFATIINYVSPKGLHVDTILTQDDVGAIIDRIRDAKLSRVIGNDVGF